MRQAGAARSGGEFVIGVQEGVHQQDDDILHRARALVEKSNDWVAGEGLSYAERYIKGWLEICFLFRLSGSDGKQPVGNGGIGGGGCEHVAVFRSCVPEKSLAGDFYTAGEHGVDTVGGDFGCVARQDQELMLVSYIEPMKAFQYLMPARIRLQSAYRFDDLFAGELYLSAINGSFKSLRFAREREGDVIAARGSILGQSEHHKVKGGTEIVNRVPEDGGEVFWDGYLGFGRDGELAGFGIERLDQYERALLEKGIDLSAKVADVMFGARDLHLRTKQQLLS